MSREAELWSLVGERLDRLAARDGETRFWLRDDDAVGPTPRLDALLAMAAAAGAPLALAVIPAGAKSALAARLAPLSGVAVLPHGFAHRNHAPANEKKTELGDHRPTELVLAELAAGHARLAGFPHYAPLLVPPWNRIGPGVAAGLAALGFRGLSLYGDRRRNPAAPGLRQVNTHFDPVDWRGGGGFVGRERALEMLGKRLGQLLSGEHDPAEPTGILSHHLAQDAATFIFLGDLLRYLAKRSDCRFLFVDELLAGSSFGQ
ncbi:polysaccharide deacetylase [Aureimonas endophytica]|uniref:Polysaccharide deacetylase n=1 Tax=Aureimonas endophytica TaxID=2027858 RepID=A0A917EA95_9HYPH|nr:hypothetical protein [Aureimonas endophytica]GGE15904.1 polysaccharide deacetylase [Aureimonas endophytica]